ncbi:ensconsin isoform X7 [Phlebotomus papatasi]|uniref:ensconsin isoform X7 n=1 Tax=Phlebotomus papatasi TaxID=29031 RepID=UPI002484363A|nr:ensconsin isoform X7 [Phlebotomus papatasi]
MASSEENTSVKKDNLAVKETAQAAKEREDRVRMVRERQNEERQRKLDELKAHALAAQRFREQKEEERRRRLEESRSRDTDRRHQVEERKRAIQEAERERREYLLRKNQEREARFETKRRNERSSIVFAFGSSTPRLLDPGEMGTVSPSQFWNHRRATSISNIAYSGAPLTRRSSERELNEAPKKRATSATALDRQREGRAVSMTRLDQLARPVRRNGEHISAILERERQQEIALLSPGSSPISQGRDLQGRSTERKSMSKSMIHLAPSKYRKSCPPANLNHSADGGQMRRSPLKLSRSMCNLDKSGGGSIRKIDAVVTVRKADNAKDSVDKAGMRSGEVTPGGTLSSRPNSAMSNSTVVSSTVSRRSGVAPRKPRPASIAVTGVSLQNGNNADGQKGSVKQEKPPLPKVTAQIKKNFSSGSSSLMTRSLDLSGKKSLERAPIKSRGSSKNTTPLLSPGVEKDVKIPPQQQKVPASDGDAKIPLPKEEKPAQIQKEVKQEVQEEVKKEEVKKEVPMTEEVDNKKVEEEKVEVKVQENGVREEETKETTVTEEVVVVESTKVVEQQNNSDQDETSDVMSTSMMSKSRITTEEEAKAALAERRRLAREEAERQAEAERLRIEAEEEAERQRIAEEEERQRQLEQEALRLAEEQRKAEEERLARAIEEARKREEEERLQREEEARQKAEREEQEKKAREEAEKLRLQTAERHRREEMEREERRKRVEAIMSRTRPRGSVGGTPTKGSGDEKSGGDGKNDGQNSGQEQTTQEQTESADIHSKNIPSNNQKDTESEKMQKQQQQQDYEQSVTEKENALLGSFTHHIVDSVNNKSTNHFHGQPVIGDGHQENVLIPDVINNKVLNNTTENGFKNSGVDNILSSVDCTNNVVDSKVLAMNQDNAKQPDQQLIDFDSLPQQQQIEDVFNYNNNNDRANTTSAIPSLVTADSQENRDISLF